MNQLSTKYVSPQNVTECLYVLCTCSCSLSTGLICLTLSEGETGPGDEGRRVWWWEGVVGEECGGGGEEQCGANHEDDGKEGYQIICKKLLKFRALNFIL